MYSVSVKGFCAVMESHTATMLHDACCTGSDYALNVGTYTGTFCMKVRDGDIPMD